MAAEEAFSFYESIEPFDSFADVVDEGRYRSLPDDWIVGVADVVESTAAIAAGRYKAVNLVGASVISATMNVLGGRSFPFVFAGDGASFAVPSSVRHLVEPALAATRTWADEEVQFDLRAALVPIADIRAAGRDLKVARYNVSPHLDYAMMTGGGLTWAEEQMKAGRYSVAPAAPGSRPDLAGLSCRWMPIEARNGEIASILVMPRADAHARAFGDLVTRINDLVRDGLDRAGHPIPVGGPRFRWPPPGLDLEVSASPGQGSRAARKLHLVLESLLGWVLFKTGIPLGAFDPTAYRHETAHNTDYRKFDDGLMLTLDCRPDLLARIEVILEHAQADGIADFGVHRQDRALMTCIVPSVMQKDHIHFVDGAAGGYARAAQMLKANRAAAAEAA
jgi:hypothetical protein